MKDLFPGYFYDASEIYAEVWGDGIIVPDANVLLNMYRYSDDTRREFLTVLTELREMLWVPNQVAFEFLKNRLIVINEQAESYGKSLASVSTLLGGFKKSTHHPVVSVEAIANLKLACEAVEKELNDNRQACLDLVSKDSIKLEIGNLFLSKTGAVYSEERLRQLVTDGATRYERKVPPGYKDADKKSDASDHIGLAPYGDLIIWNQLLDYAREHSKNVIFITGDSKEDWWLRSNGMMITPRPELVEEFKSVTGKNIILYSPERFIEHYNKRSGSEAEKVSESAYAEVVEVSSVDRLKNHIEMSPITESMYFKGSKETYDRYYDINKKRDELRSRLDECNKLQEDLLIKRDYFVSKSNKAREFGELNMDKAIQINLESIHRALLQNMNAINSLDSELMSLDVEAVHAKQDFERMFSKSDKWWID